MGRNPCKLNKKAPGWDQIWKRQLSHPRLYFEKLKILNLFCTGTDFDIVCSNEKHELLQKLPYKASPPTFPYRFPPQVVSHCRMCMDLLKQLYENQTSKESVSCIPPLSHTHTSTTHGGLCNNGLSLVIQKPTHYSIA